jgi:exopolyphosphatase/guanosine-5'-triphosphate,3'-diphosphate pyrophosphatase
MDRYEFRVWGHNLIALKRTLEEHAEPSQPATSSELYFVSETTDKCSAKIRSSLLDIKVLVRIDGTLERWTPIVKAGFPLAASAINQLFESLALKPPRLSQSNYIFEEFLNDVIKPERAIVIANVSKERSQFRIDACEAEYAAVTIDGLPRHTVAVEGSDPDAVLSLIRQLGIEQIPNTSYVREIKHLLLDQDSEEKS